MREEHSTRMTVREVSEIRFLGEVWINERG